VNGKVNNYSKTELLEIYNKAKKGQYDLMQLPLEQIKLLNRLLEEEIKLKSEKLMNI